MSIPVIAIFDIGKTNKKVFLFDEDYKIRFEKSVHLPEIKDEEDFPCEDIHALTQWVKDSFKELTEQGDFNIKAINISAHGASFVHIDEGGKPVTPLYNYLKPYPEELKKKFYKTYGGEDEFARLTASPVLGHLNSGMQLYWLKYERPELFKQIKYSLHLPEYISYLFSGQPTSGITSIGCHTNLWNFATKQYHNWVAQENLLEKLAPIRPSYKVDQSNHTYKVGIGLHDSSAALIPYLQNFKEPFLLLSTGTWSISLNPFNHSVLTTEELKQDCLSYLSYDASPVKAARLFAGYMHDESVKQLSIKYNKGEDYYQHVKFDATLIDSSDNFIFKGIDSCQTYEVAYHHILADLIQKQKKSTDLIIQNSIKNLYVDGGFSKNTIFMHLLAKIYPSIDVHAADLHQASALGAALAIHDAWNQKEKPDQLIQLIKF
jgi:L-fuculokinase